MNKILLIIFQLVVTQVPTLVFVQGKLLKTPTISKEIVLLDEKNYYERFFLFATYKGQVYHQTDVMRKFIV